MGGVKSKNKSRKTVISNSMNVSVSSVHANEFQDSDHIISNLNKTPEAKSYSPSIRENVTIGSLMRTAFREINQREIEEMKRMYAIIEKDYHQSDSAVPISLQISLATLLFCPYNQHFAVMNVGKIMFCTDESPKIPHFPSSGYVKGGRNPTRYATVIYKDFTRINSIGWIKRKKDYSTCFFTNVS